MQLSCDRTPLISIMIKEEELHDTSSSTRFAAKELRYYLGRMTSVSFPIEAYTPDKAGIVLGAACQLATDGLGDDGFIIRSVGNQLALAGGVRGVLYAVYELLERVGCRFFTRDCEYVPTIPDLTLADDYDLTMRPAFEYREHDYADVTQSLRFAAKCRLNGARNKLPKSMGGHMPYAWYVHTFERMVPPSIYGETHPEYYALVDGVRVVRGSGRTQLCLSNPEVMDICVDAVRKALHENPEARLISISQNDWHRDYCHCPDCSRTDEEEGSPSGTLLRFVNKIAEILEPEFPHIIFDTLAYTYTRPAPSITRNRRNVCVRLCSIESCFCHPFTAGHDARPTANHGRTFISDLEEWGKICDRVYIWDYVTAFAHYATPHPNWRVLQPNMQSFYENNVRGVYEQGNRASRGGVDFNELRNYLISKLLWDPYCDIETHRQEFLSHYYGAAAPYLDAYLNLVCDTAEALDHVGFNDAPTHAFLSEEMLDQYDALFDKARDAVKGDALRLQRVEKNRLSIRYVRIKRATMLHGEYDADALNQFFADWQAFGLSRLDEWANIESSHRAMLDGKWRGIAYFDHWRDEEPEIL